MRHVNVAYTQVFNRRHRMVGHLSQRRFKAILFDRDEYPLKRCRYVERNPVALQIDPPVRIALDTPIHLNPPLTNPLARFGPRSDARF